MDETLHLEGRTCLTSGNLTACKNKPKFGREGEKQSRQGGGPGIPPLVTHDQLIRGIHRIHKMGPPSKKTMKSEAARDHEALDKGKNPMAKKRFTSFARAL